MFSGVTARASGANPRAGKPGTASRPAAEEVARLCHALSDPTRLAILDRLRGGERCVCDLVDLLGAAQSRLSFHMKTLKDAGLVADRREGRWIHYSLNPEALHAIHEFLAFLRSGNAEDTACCRRGQAARSDP
jgi:ArsR family transcriptional regulator